jgi:CBS domain-containing protein
METVADLLAGKLGDVVATSPNASVRQATWLMNDHSIGSLLVTESDRLVGIFTERDVLRRVVAEGRSPETTPVNDVMTREVVCVTPETLIEEVADLMRRRRIRHVPIINADESVVGVVSIGDINAHRFAACATELVQVQAYIMGRA